MHLPQLVLLLFATVLIDSEDIDEKEFIHMVVDGINAINNYTLRTNNSELLSTEDDEVQNYGEFDFVIVGGGAAGTLLANRLSENEEYTVLLLEAGGPETDFSDIPGTSGFLYFSDMNWGYKSIPQKHFGDGTIDRRIPVPRGQVVGGSSVINAKMLVRGNKLNFDEWENLGNTGWSYDRVLPYFKKFENFTHYGDDGYHGTSGPLSVSCAKRTMFYDIYMDAMKELGYDEIDYNGKNQIGASQIMFTLAGRKASTGGRAFIDPIINKRNNLNLVLNAFVTQLLLIGKKVEGVKFIKDKKSYVAFATKETILCAGAINTPQILMLSGIGPKDELETIKVTTIANLPVGKNLVDHPSYVGISFKTNVSLFDQPFEKYITDYLQNLRPLTASFNVGATSFFTVSDDKTKTIPDIQHIVVVPPGILTDTARFFNLNKEAVEGFKYYNRHTDIYVLIILLNPKSKGSLTLSSNNPIDFPEIDINFFSDPNGEDMEMLYKGIMKTLKLTETESFKKVNATFAHLVVGCEDFDPNSKEYWYCAIRHLTQTLYHPTGTTRMGISETDSVVSPTLKVHGIENLRCVDAGVMPTIPSGNILAAVYMIAEKAADLIKSEYGMN